jgi:integrase
MASEKITKTTLGRLRRLTKRGRKSVEIRDLVQPGLSVRLTGRRLSWYFRYSTTQVGGHGHAVRTAEPICTIDACGDPEKMRAVVATGKAALQDRRDPMAAVRTALAVVLRLPETRRKDADPAAPVMTTWDFANMRREFRENPPDWLREETVKGYARAMSAFQVGDLNKKFLTEITAGDIRAVRSAIEQRGNKRQAALTIQAIKSAFEWSSEDDQKSRSGISPETNPAAEVSTKRRHKKRTKADAIAAAGKVKFDADGELVFDDGTVPTRKDLGLLVLLLLDSSKLPLLKRAVLLLLLFTVQRRYSVACALHQAVITFETSEYSIWVMDGGTTKAGLPHILPFTRTAGDVIEEWKATSSAGDDWLFPSIPTRVKPKATGHLNVRTLNDWLEAAWKQAGASRVYAPHKIRKAFDTYLSRSGVSRADRKLILHHHEGRDGDVTEEHYNFDPRLDEKLHAIGKWNEFLRSCADEAKQAERDSSIADDKTVINISPAKTSSIGTGKGTSQLNPAYVEDLPGRASNYVLNDPLDSSTNRQTNRAPSSTDANQIEKLRQRLQKRAAFDAAIAELEKGKGR